MTKLYKIFIQNNNNNNNRSKNLHCRNKLVSKWRAQMDVLGSIMSATITPSTAPARHIIAVTDISAGYDFNVTAYQPRSNYYKFYLFIHWIFNLSSLKLSIIIIFF